MAQLRQAYAVGDSVREGQKSTLFKGAYQTSYSRLDKIPLKASSPALSPKLTVKEIVGPKTIQSQGRVITLKNPFTHSKRYMASEYSTVQH